MADGLLHNSMFATLRACEQKYVYRYVDELDEDKGRALYLGSWFHALMQAQGLKQGSVQETLLHPVDTIDLGFDGLDPVDATAFGPVDGADFVRNVHEFIREEVHAYLPTGDEAIASMPEDAYSLYERYLAYHIDTLLSEKVLGVEVEWQRDGYGGKVDRVIERADGLIVLRDHKTTGRKPSSDFRLTNSQLHLYAWGIHPWLQEHGLQAEAIEYDYAITRKVPDIALTKAGNLYATAKGADPYSITKGLLELGEDPEDEKWADTIAKASENWEKYFSRNLMPVNVRVIVALLQENKVLLERAEDIMTGKRLPIRNTGMQCEMCGFSTLCSGDLYGNDTSLLKSNMKESM